MADGAVEGVRVFVRVRPPLDREVLQEGGVAVTTPNDGASVIIDGKDHTVKCHFDRVFGDSCSQADVFEEIKPAIAQVGPMPFVYKLFAPSSRAGGILRSTS